ncbi:D-glycero-alpha-D-manno-heptose-1,7-bisphosphate 7-phosphatase [Acanthopleuribacter pedis]|uniref:D,D-heptose 1,7-bisphosphate phosphatase n=1 Tax=Acanthopleuribacter pedis TaxID=442870 RepID=A0A8J7Q1T9_9BACT|nr:HAD family hydrolase [Acanthopleuribacter pedis]MBO1316872.1 HAD family hydrolase [Acanthopleuribacter pedis]
MTQPPIATLFLDRDGVLNRRIVDDYVTCRDEFEILPGVPSSLRALQEAGFRLVVVTNQRGIAVGRMTRAAVDDVHVYLNQHLAEVGATIDAFYVCPHDRHVGCPCRKPAPGLLDQAHRDQPVDWAASYLIGDSDSDIAAGRARGVTTLKVAGEGDGTADWMVPDIAAATAKILAHQNG